MTDQRDAITPILSQFGILFAKPFGSFDAVRPIFRKFSRQFGHVRLGNFLQRGPPGFSGGPRFDVGRHLVKLPNEETFFAERLAGASHFNNF